MHPLRKQRVYAIVTVFLGIVIAMVLVMSALSKNMNLFYSPSELLNSEISPGSIIRAGGMVASGSIEKSSDSLEVMFLITDFQNSLPVVYNGILPDLFSEDAGVVVKGFLQEDGTFFAQEVLAKHDENYMPPEVAKMLDKVE
jgi:cytochrome c-type biogenesis protein CcmE